MEYKLKRIWEIDFLRGIALLLMIIFHVVFDLRDIYNFAIYYDRGFYYYVGKASVILFMIVSGISCSLSRSNFKRGVKVFLIAMGITLVTHFFDPELEVKFGVLHFFGISMMLYPLLRRMDNYLMIGTALASIVTGNIFSKIIVSQNYLFPLGLTTNTFASSDYYPLFPWLGVFLFGIVIGRVLYKEKKSIFKYKMPDNPFLFLGRHTLSIYVLHQPLILIILSLLTDRNAFF